MNALENALQRLVMWIRGLFRRKTIYTNTELTYRKRVQQLVDYFRGDQLSYLSDVLSTQFTNPTALKLQMQFSNVVAAVVTRLCSTFKYGVTISTEVESDQEKVDELLDQTNFDAFVKTLEQYLYLCKTVFVKPTWIESEQRMMLDLITPEFVEVIPTTENPYEMAEIIYPKEITRYDTLYAMPEGEFNYWTPTNFSIVNEKKISATNESNPDNINPYGIIPVAAFRASFPLNGQFFIWPGEELTVAQDALNIKLTQLNALIKFQSHGVPVFVNPPTDFYGNVSLNVDVSTPIALKSNSKDEPSDFKFVSPDAKIEALQASIDKDYLRLFAFYGIDSSDFIQTGNTQSAEALQLKNSAVDEYRTQMRQTMIPQLKKLFDIMIIVWNTHNPTNQISSDELTIKIQDSKVSFDTKDELIKFVDWQVLNNYMSKIDAMILLHDDMDEDDARKSLEENAMINEEFESGPEEVEPVEPVEPMVPPTENMMDEESPDDSNTEENNSEELNT